MGGLEIRRGEEGAPLVADRRLYLNRDRDRLVEAGDPKAAFLLAAGPGDFIAAEDVVELGLAVEDGRVVQVGEEAAEEPKPNKDKADDAGSGAPKDDPEPKRKGRGRKRK